MSYVDDSLSPGEIVVYRAHLHRSVLIWPLAVPFLIWLITGGQAEIGLLAAIVGLVWLGTTYARYKKDEFAVTDRRFVAKLGWIRRSTWDVPLDQVEGVAVDQGMIDRLFHKGTVIVTGTGGTRAYLTNLADPLRLQRQLQTQLPGN